MEQNETKSRTQENNKESEQKENEDCTILPSDYPKYDYNYKVIIIGDSGVGKTCLTIRATTGEFEDKQPPTLGFDYYPFFMKYKEKVIKLELWDTCGQEVYRSLIKSFFTNASLAIIVYGVNDIKTFNSVEEWIMQCKKECSPDIKFVLIANKVDIDVDE